MILKKVICENARNCDNPFCLERVVHEPKYFNHQHVSCCTNKMRCSHIDKEVMCVNIENNNDDAIKSIDNVLSGI